ncbi:MAG: ATP-binding cassette domain-containing protein [Pseudomonadales bacterium]|nr:ATP-binding cassette domain-containing protein [Pseudomonadales bacterium]
MELLQIKDVTLAYGHTALLDKAQLQINTGDRISLIGRNGTGKSTLLKVILGEQLPDTGEVIRRQNLVITQLPQEVPIGSEGTIFALVTKGLGDISQLLIRYENLTHEIAENCTDEVMKQLEKVQHDIEAQHGWSLYQQVESILTRMDLDGQMDFSGLSGGMKRRVLIAQALVSSPDILLLDEPTNHLDIEAIIWLEEFLKDYQGCLIFITHDRSFLKSIANRIVELDRGQLTEWPGQYDLYLEQKQHALEVEEDNNDKFDKKLAAEEVWIRQGIKARRTRNEGRARALQSLRDERRQRRNQLGKARLESNDAEKSGKLVIEVESIHVEFDNNTIIDNFSTSIWRGDKIGIIGPNGCGKSTLLKTFLNKLTPQKGTVTQGTKLDIAYFDQLRDQLDETLSVRENIGEGSDQVIINGQPKHVIGYLQDFLFTPARAQQPVSSLSGGEKNRLLLAKLFTQPANLFILDEPTNDLDAETLDLLEELLTQYKGTLLLVSHDRTFLNNVVTSTIVFEGEGKITEYVGGYDDWQHQIKASKSTAVEKNKRPQSDAKQNSHKKQDVKPDSHKKQENQSNKKISFKQQRELNTLTQKIELLESEINEIQDTMANSAFYQQDKASITQTNEKLAQINKELEVAYSRWEELEDQS